MTKEQQQMYEILGISLSSFTQINYDPGDTMEENKSQNEFEEVSDNIQEIEPYDDSEDENEHDSSQKEYNNELVNNTLEKGSSIYLKNENNTQQVVKKPFLKRGAGLSSRFRIAPDKFNLKNLPRYKYQDRLLNTIRKQRGETVQDPKGSSSRRSNENPKRASNEGTQKSIDKAKKSDNKENFKPKISTKAVVCVEQSTELSVPKNINLVPSELKLPPPKEMDFEKLLPKQQEQNLIEETPKVSRTLKSTCWAQMLSSNNISDCSIKIGQMLNEPVDDEDHDETDLFQLLEERIKNLDSSPTSLMELLASLRNDEKSNDDTIVNPDDPLIDESEAVCLHLEPRPEELVKKITIDDSENSFDEEEETQSSDHRVRFAENVEIMQQNTLGDDDANLTILSNDLEAGDLSQTSTPNEKQKFEDFKLKILGRQKQRDELVDKVDQLKLKLQEIEREKANILKIRSNLELEKIQLEHDRDDLAEKLKDERIKMEIELHDERIKLDQQKQKYEKLTRDFKNQSSKKEREEIVKLKETIEEIKEEAKNKEARHGSTSARYRSQIKQLEKENQTLKLELEMARKDNKRLEVENVRLKRDTNSKMLQEINKNIAKLAKPEIIATEKPKVSSKKVAPPKRIEPTRKRVQSVPDLPSAKTTELSSSESEDEAPQSRPLNPVKTRMSDPKSTQSSADALDMKREIENEDGSKDIWYPNGNLKKISSDGMLLRMLYYNKDIKETNINEGTVKYYYADTNTWHTTYIDGLEILEYPK